MSRSNSIALLALSAVIFTVMSAGCADDRQENATDVYNTTAAGGHVYLDEKPVAGAHVEALSVDGTLHASNVTDDSGGYILNLKPQVWYRVSAKAHGFKHTIWPVFVSGDSYRKDGFDINLTRTPRTLITGAPAGDSKWKGNGTYITAAPADGNAPVTTITGDDGSFSIEVKPDMYYTVSGASYDYRGAGSGDVPIRYRNTVGCNKIKPGRDETVLLDYVNRLETPPALVVNSTVGLAKVNVSPPAPQPSSPVPACGHVNLNGSPVKGATVEAVSIDGADRISTVTNGSGAYVLAVEPGVHYKVTATYKGLRHTLNPLNATEDTSGGVNDINLTTTPVSEIIARYEYGRGYPDNPLLIEAIPSDGGMPVVQMRDDYGRYALEVRPGIDYRLGGRYYDRYGQAGYVSVSYPKENPGPFIKLAPDETLLVDIKVGVVHPPKSISMYRDPVTGSHDIFKPPVPVTVTGNVYFDNRPVSGAQVDAFRPSFAPEKRASAVTNDSGAYVMTVDSRTQYTISANYNGLSCSTWPVIVQDNTTGVCDITITWTTISTIAGVPDSDQPWLSRLGNVISAIPVGGGKAVSTVSGGDGSYSLDVKPFTYYDISGQCQGPDGQTHNLSFYYRNGVSCTGFMLRENETVMINYYAPGIRTWP